MVFSGPADFENPLTFSSYVVTMSDGVGITKANTTAVALRPSVYRSESAREVRARAAAVQQETSPEELDGLKRLNRILGQDRPLRDNVPRGYYLNITI